MGGILIDELGLEWGRGKTDGWRVLIPWRRG